MMDAYSHLDMSSSEPLSDFQSRMASAQIDRALVVETWKGDNYSCLQRLIDSPLPNFRVVPCFRAAQTNHVPELLGSGVVMGLRVKTAELQLLGQFALQLESQGKWLLLHAENGIGALTHELTSLVARHPRLRVYVPHLAWPRRAGTDDNDWIDSVAELSRIPGVVIGISAIAHFSREPFPHSDVATFVSRLLETFPTDSIAVGSDYPLFEKTLYTQYMELAVGWVREADTGWSAGLEASCFHNQGKTAGLTGRL